MISEPFDVDDHELDRALWSCRRCGAAFPCVPARERLQAGLGSVPLAMFMWAALNAAVQDLGDVAPARGELFDRFIGWTRTAAPDEAQMSESDRWRGYHTVIAVLRHDPKEYLRDGGP